MICTVLIENSAQAPELTSQHGLSILIEYNRIQLLLDTGQNELFAENATVLGKKLDKVDIAVCSHAHYDHAGGFNTFCEINRTAPIYTLWKPGTNYYSTTHCSPGESARFIGFRLLPEYEGRLRFGDYLCPVSVADGCWIVPVTEHPAALPYKNRTLFTGQADRLVHDTFRHECVLAVETGLGRNSLALFNSCSHNGVINSIKSVLHFFPGRQIVSYTGGFHFPWKRDEAIAAEDIAAMDELAAYAVVHTVRLYSGHCSGEGALDYLEQKCNGLLTRLHTGLSFEV